MDFKYIQNYFADDSMKEYTMNLKAPIGEMYCEGISGKYFAQELDFLASLPELETIHIRICSPGGSVIEGMSIISSMLNCKKKIITYADGFVASIASLIFICGDETRMWDAGLLMFHGVSGGSKESLEFFTASLSTIYQKRLGKSEAEVAEWMSKDTYFKADDAKRAGIVDVVYDTPARDKYIDTEVTAENVTALFNLSVANLGVESPAPEDQNQKTTEEMELSKFIEVLNLAPEATVEDVLTQVETVKNAAADVAALATEKADLLTQVDNYLTELTSVKNELVEKETALATLATEVENKATEVTNLSEKVSAFEAEAALRHAAKIEALVNAAVESNRIQAAVKNEWVEMATENFERTEKIINAIRPAKMKLTDVVEVENTATGGATSFATEMQKIAAKTGAKKGK